MERQVTYHGRFLLTAQRLKARGENVGFLWLSNNAGIICHKCGEVFPVPQNPRPVAYDQFTACPHCYTWYILAVKCNCSGWHPAAQPVLALGCKHTHSVFCTTHYLRTCLDCGRKLQVRSQ